MAPVTSGTDSSGISAYLVRKSAARERIVRAVLDGNVEPIVVSASVRVAGVSGVRVIRIRGHEVVSDSSSEYAGYDLGPTSPELQAGVLGSCVAHTVLIHAAERGIPLDSVEVAVSAKLDPRGGVDGFDRVPPQPFDLSYELTIASPADPTILDELARHVDAVCPILNLLRAPSAVHASLRLQLDTGVR